MAGKAAPGPSGRDTVSRDNRGDLTGKQIKEAQKQAEKDAAERATALTVAREQEAAEASNVLVNYTDEPATPEELEAVGAVEEAEEVDEVEEREPEVVDTPVSETIRSRESITFVKGVDASGEQRVYSFEAGRAYKVPADVAAHMREKGLVWS